MSAQRTARRRPFPALVLAAAVACAGGSAPAAGEPGPLPAPGEKVAATGATAPAAGTAQQAGYDGERALEHARQVVAFGPRPVGSDALERTRVYIEETIAGFGLEARRDAFTAATPEGPIPMANLIVEVPAADGNADAPVVIVSGHYDTAGSLGAFEFVGANDGGSSTAALLELARVLAEEPPPLPVWIVFFDGEEAVVRWEPGDNTYGSRYMVQNLQETGDLQRVRAMILLDMVGDADLAFQRELNSTPWLMDLVWEAAAEAGHGEHFLSSATAIDDDHVPFMQAGIPSVDLIDFQYGPGHRYWHSPFDTIDKLGADSFQVVGDTVLAALPKLAERLTQ